MKIEVSGLCKSFHDAERELAILSEVNLSLPSGSHTALLGRSGVGKTTFLQILGGLSRADSGSIRYDDTDISLLKGDELSRFRGVNVGFVFQFHQLLAEFSAWENVAMPLLVAGMREAEARRRSEELLETVGLSSRLTHRPGQLSGGEQQRVAIARALVTAPGVILADEPTGSLDHETGAQVKHLLLSICSQLRITLVVVTHSRELADEMKMVYEMKSGGVCVPADGYQAMESAG